MLIAIAEQVLQNLLEPVIGVLKVLLENLIEHQLQRGYQVYT